MKWKGFGPSLWEPLQFVSCMSSSQRLRTGGTPLGMSLPPFLTEPLPCHFSRAANTAPNTVGHRTEIRLTSPCRQQILITFGSSASCHYSEVFISCVPKDAQGGNIQAYIPQGIRMAGKGSSSPSVRDALGSKDTSVLVLEAGKKLWDQSEGFQSWEACKSA